MIHLLRMAARIQDLDELQDVQTHFRTHGKGAKAVVIMTTRNMPKRADELMAGGSIYWIVRTAFRPAKRFSMLPLLPILMASGCAKSVSTRR